MTPEEIIAAVRQHAADAGVPLDLENPTTDQETAAAPYRKLIAEQQAIINHRDEKAQRDAMESILVAVGAQKPRPDVPPWDPDTDYTSGDVVNHDGRLWEAMDDVTRGTPPDDVYDIAAGTGGWQPFEG